MDRFIQKIAKDAGRAVLKRFGKEGVHRTKSHARWDVVTKADLLSEKIMISAIRGTYPHHGIISEESGAINESAEYVWILDPIDGTLNYSLGVPAFGVMVCLVHKGHVLLSAINMPATKEFFFAKAGRGAYLNGKRIHCTKPKRLRTTFGMHGTTLNPRTTRFLQRVLRFSVRGHILLGSFSGPANACYVAAGRRDWVVSLSGKIWDFAPVYLLLKEAGCTVTDTKGKPWTMKKLELVAANPVLHKQLLKLTKGV
ncbi:inositol monophosphatase [Candidatus Kaiserbacteria bacterium]|nr:inositol monophosphatase [Candidatus Kaiserbacteria bacterium]